MRLLPEPERTPWAGPLTIAYVSGSPSTSVAGRPTIASESSARSAELSVATGGSFTGSTVIETVATFDSLTPSLARNVKLSGPL